MQKDLHSLVRELRNETCPQRVIDRTQAILREDPPLPSRFRYALPLAVAALALLCSLLVWRQPAGKDAPPTNPAHLPGDPHMQAARQTQRALALLGSALYEAGAHSEQVLSDRAIPPLRTSFQTAKNKIIHDTQL